MVQSHPGSPMISTGYSNFWVIKSTLSYAGIHRAYRSALFRSRSPEGNARQKQNDGPGAMTQDGKVRAATSRTHPGRLRDPVSIRSFPFCTFFIWARRFCLGNIVAALAKGGRFRRVINPGQVAEIGNKSRKS